MVLEKVDPHTIELNEKVSFFRGIIQGFTEINIIYASKKLGQSAYMAATGNGGTFVTNSLLQGIGYAKYWDFKIGKSGIPEPFTRYVSLLEIDGKPYLDRLYIENKREGYVIAGPINLKDIKVLFGADRNTLTDDLELEGRTLPSDRARGDMRNRYLSRRDELLMMAGESPEKTLSRSYKINPEATVEQAYKFFNNMHSGVHPNFLLEDVVKTVPVVVSIFGPQTNVT